IIWENISIPVKQIRMRKSIANSILAIGALFWSLVVAFISAATSLESISEEIPALKEYADTEIYTICNYYLAIGILLILLALLPFVFDFISRSYEGVKTESEIQNAIMHRYFNYQLANVFVAVGLGSIATSLNQIIDNPSAILSILGNSVASFSIYFANLMITRTFTGIPIEMLRIFNLLDIALVYLCKDKRKCTRRELRTGAFADCPMLYGWIYPNVLMGLMIMCTYACISPFILPLCLAFFALLFLMYKYQLLYVYVNKSQAGGYMWYTLYNQSMLVLLCGVVILVCYLAIRQVNELCTSVPPFLRRFICKIYYVDIYLRPILCGAAAACLYPALLEEHQQAIPNPCAGKAHRTNMSSWLFWLLILINSALSISGCIVLILF
ncbi:hypothetical protein EON64_18035, partial [archaeon]